MTPTDVLREEHKGIRQVLRIFETMCTRLDSGAQVPGEDPAWMMDFFETFVDRCHHGKEERYLFPALEAAEITDGKALRNQLLQEHRLGREHVVRMKNTLTRSGPQGPSVFAELPSLARLYIRLLTDHIRKENDLLFPAVDRHVPKARQHEMIAEFHRLERDEMGVGIHEAFHERIEKLAENYPA